MGGTFSFASGLIGGRNLKPRRRRGEGVVDAHSDSPLLGPLLDDLGEVFEAEVLKKLLSPTVAVQVYPRFTLLGFNA